MEWFVVPEKNGRRVLPPNAQEWYDNAVKRRQEYLEEDEYPIDNLIEFSLVSLLRYEHAAKEEGDTMSEVLQDFQERTHPGVLVTCVTNHCILRAMGPKAYKENYVHQKYFPRILDELASYGGRAVVEFIANVLIGYVEQFGRTGDDEQQKERAILFTEAAIEWLSD